MKTVVLGVSGGVDSAVSAYLLQRQGYHVVGVFMDQLGKTSERDAAAAVCQQLGIEFHVAAYQAIFQTKIIERYLAASQGDVTPNPCCWCNPTVKFPCLLAYADQIGADYVATGHYAQICHGQLCRGADTNKDQSYFLAGLPAAWLPRLLFPLGAMTKAAVRALAAQIGLPVAHKADSTDMCFSVPPRPLTIGQGLKQGGCPEKLYYLGGGRYGNAQDPALFRQDVLVANFNWLVPLVPTQTYTGKIRSRQTPQACTATILPDGQVQVHFLAPVRAVTPGQWCVLYLGDQVVGGGEIQ